MDKARVKPIADRVLCGGCRFHSAEHRDAANFPESRATLSKTFTRFQVSVVYLQRKNEVVGRQGAEWFRDYQPAVELLQPTWRQPDRGELSWT